MATDDAKNFDELMSQLKIVKDRVRGVIHRTTNGVYIHGRPGTSKTYTVCSTLDILHAGYKLSNGHLTPIGLFHLIADNRDGIIVIDDLASIFNQPIALQLLLAALGTPHDGSNVRQVWYQTAKETRVVPFSGAIICISNLALDGHHHGILAALRDRAYVINFEPSDEQISALILNLADTGVRGVTPEEARMVATYLLDQCKPRGIRPSVRLFVDKALPDYLLFTAGKTETDWKDLVVSNLEQQLVALRFPTNDIGRAEQIEVERRIAKDIYLTYEAREERVVAWKERTGKSESAFYRRYKESRRQGPLSVVA